MHNVSAAVAAGVDLYKDGPYPKGNRTRFIDFRLKTFFNETKHDWRVTQNVLKQ